tara:strand:+ start:9213 stop:10166 length:954 start_codon:yes stop_codon:yes gene_type:complete
MEKNIALILGISGQDGSYLAKILIQKNYRVFGTSRGNCQLKNFKLLNIEKKQIKIFKLKNFNITNLVKIIKNTKCTKIFYLSGISSVNMSFQKDIKTISDNSLNFLMLLEAVKIVNKKIKIFNPLSSECFGHQKKKISEKTKFLPLSPYALAKVINYYFAKLYEKTDKLWIANVFLFNHESPLRPKNFILNKIFEGAKKIKLKKIKYLELGNINIKRDWGWAYEYMQFIYLIMSQNKPDDYVLATEKTVKLKYVLKNIFNYKKLDYRKYVKINKNLIRPKDINSNYANTSKLNKKFKKKPSIDIDRIILKFINKQLF